MAYASWANPNKTSGSGNDTVNWGASEHTGRLLRTTHATFKADGVNDVDLEINQTGKTEFVDIAASAAVQKTGGTITITGTSNSKKLTFSLSNNGINLPAVTTYIAASQSATSGSDISGDPGATQQYTFSVTFADIPANTAAAAKTSQLTVTTDNGTTDSCTITQAAADPTLSISPATITIPAAGTPAQSVAVTSNTNWTVV